MVHYTLAIALLLSSFAAPIGAQDTCPSVSTVTVYPLDCSPSATPVIVTPAAVVPVTPTATSVLSQVAVAVPTSSVSTAVVIVSQVVPTVTPITNVSTPTSAIVAVTSPAIATFTGTGNSLSPVFGLVGLGFGALAFL